MKIGVLGSGGVGQTLATGFAALGHEVRIGTRAPAKPEVQEWVRKTGKLASASTFADTAAFADLALLATLWTGTESALQLAGPANLAGKTVIDVTNPLAFHPDKPPMLSVGHTDSGGERVQRWLPKSHVVKAFNTVGSALMVHPKLSGGPPDMFICGNDTTAKQTVTRICTDFGWQAIDIGGIEGSRLLEPMCLLWILYGIRSGTWNHAFKLLR